MCVDACPVGALSIEKDVAAGVSLDEYENIWVFAQVDAAGTVLPVALELLGRARELADERGCRLAAVVGEAAEANDDNARTLMGAGADEVIRTCDDRLAHADAEVFAAWLAEPCQHLQARGHPLRATNFGRELAPRVAVLLQTGLTADCTVLETDAEAGLLQQTRPAFRRLLHGHDRVPEPPSADGHRAPRILPRRAARGAQRHRDQR